MNKVILISGLSIYLIISCTIKDANIHTYIHPGYMPGQIMSVAFLTVRESAVKEIEARRLNSRIFQAFIDKNPNVEVLSQTESKTLFTNNHLLNQWHKFLDEYETYGRPDITILNTIGSTLTIDGIMQGEIVEFIQIEGKVGVNRATTKAKVRYRLFDIHRGRLVWEAVSDGIKIAATDTEPLPSTWDVLQLTAKKISFYLPLL